MVIRTALAVGLVGCAVLAGCNGSDNKAEQASNSTRTDHIASGYH